MVGRNLNVSYIVGIWGVKGHSHISFVIGNLAVPCAVAIVLEFVRKRFKLLVSFSCLVKLSKKENLLS